MRARHVSVDGCAAAEPKDLEAIAELEGRKETP
jgi:hypothetical protein